MADGKQERILDALKQRITQLEDELRTTKDHLRNAVARNEEVSKEMDLLRAEAHDVVGQWEEEATDVRKRLEASEATVHKLKAALQEESAAKETLENHVASLEKISAEYSASVRSQQEKIGLLEKANEEAVQQLEKSQKEFGEAMQQTREYEELTMAMQKELVRAAEAEKTYVRDIESLRASLSHRTGEVEALRAQKDEISSQAERLLQRIDELKTANDQLSSEAEFTEQHAKASLVETEKLKGELSNALRERDEFNRQCGTITERCEALTAEVDRLTKMVSDAEAVSNQQLEIISGLEKDVQELQDAGTMQGKCLEEYQAQKEALESELLLATRTREEAEAQFSAIKEIYSTTLMEANEYKNTMEAKYDALAAELEKCRTDMTEALTFSDHRYEAAMESVKQLSSSLQHCQRRETTLQQQVDRLEIDLSASTGFHGIAQQVVQWMTARCGRLETLLAAKSNEMTRSTEEHATLLERYESLKVQTASTMEELSESRKSCAALESKAAAAAMENKELVDKTTSLQRDNEWLKNQVEAMRTELGDLDELLNVNLNQMQEENEKHVARANALQATVDELRESERAGADKLQQYEQNFAALESELAAQTKTLDIAESDLRAANEEIDKLQRTVAHLNNRLEEAEQRTSELSRSNALLSTQNNTMKEQIRGQEEKQALIVADKRREVENLRLKINQHVEKAEELASVAASEKQAREDAEKLLLASKESASKLRSALEELKERCASDAASLKQLISERDELVRDRDVIVERYNRLHDAFRNVKRETNGKVAEELRKMLDFSTQQENELQQLRRENLTLKKSVSMFVTSAQPKAEAVFMERLNLTEGPLRHPKKRSVAKSTEPAS